MSLSIDDMALHVEDWQKSMKLNETNQRKIWSLLELYKYKNNKEKSIVFLYMRKKESENEIKKTMPFTIAKNIILTN